MLKFRIFKSSSLWILATYELGLEGIPFPSPEAELQKAYNAPRTLGALVGGICLLTWDHGPKYAARQEILKKQMRVLGEDWMRTGLDLGRRLGERGGEGGGRATDIVRGPLARVDR